MSCGSSSNVASTALKVQGHVLCYCDGSAWYTNDGNNYYWASVCYITSPWSSPWYWRWANVVHPNDMFARMRCMSAVTEYLAMGLALRILDFYRFPIGVVVYDSENVLDLLKKGNFRCDRTHWDRKTMWEEWLSLQAVLQQLNICLSHNLQIRFRHKKYTQYAGDHDWPPQIGCDESFRDKVIVLDNFFFPNLDQPCWESVRVSTASENQGRIQWTQRGMDWIPGFRPGVPPSA